MMLKIYTTRTNQSTRKAVDWLQANGVPYQRIKLDKNHLTKQELKMFLAYSDNGISDIIKRNIDRKKLDNMTLNQALELLINDPSLLKTPILFDGKKLKCGYHKEEIRSFISKDMRKIENVLLYQIEKNVQDNY